MIVEAQKVNEKSRTSALKIMNSLAENDLNYGEALNAMMLALIYSAQTAGIDKNNLLDNISFNWDITGESETSTTH
jgi:hypothetical protein